MQDRIYKLIWSQLALLLVQASLHYYHLCLKYTLHFNPRFSIRFYLGGKSFAVGGEGKKLQQTPTCEHQRCKFLEKILKSGPLTMHFQHSGTKIRVFEQHTDIKFWLFYSGGEFTWNTRQILPATGSYWKPCTQFGNSRRYWVRQDVNQNRCRRHKKSCTPMVD